MGLALSPAHLSKSTTTRQICCTPMRPPSLKFLKTFQVAAARRSFKAAADELFITPSAVSHQIRTLEKQLGVALFERGPHSLTLTEAGVNYQRHLETVFARLEAVTEQLQAGYGREVVRLHAPPFFATEMLLPRLPSFLEARPDTDVHINTASAPLQTHAADADLSIVVGAEPDDGHAHHKLFSQTFAPACAPALLRRSPIAHVEDLNRCTLIVHEARRNGWRRWAESIGVDLRPKKVVRFDTLYAATQAAEHGVGVALVSSRIGAQRFAQGALVKLFDAEFETGESYFLIMRRDDAARADIQALRHWILDEFSDAA
jgi:LysR family transcriptional regulator, glycine cleavage system transcriptional activator